MRSSAIFVPIALTAIAVGCNSNPTTPSSAPPPTALTANPDSEPVGAEVVTGSTARRHPIGAYHAAALAGDYATYPAARALIDELVRESGFERDYLNGVFSRIERQSWILDFMNRPSAKPSTRPTGSWTRYRAKFLDEARIKQGLRFWREYQADLERAHRTYGVPPAYIVAIIGVETHYGAYMGKHPVINALATLAFDYPRRASYFTQELETFLVMARQEGLDPFAPVGSYAGAMGLGQFMPSSFQHYAVDFDGDGRRDLWSPVDAIGSVANYFKGHGWQPGEAVAIPAVARGQTPHVLKADYTTRYQPTALAAQGVTARIPLDGHDEVSLLRLDAVGGYEYWLGLHNFYVITRYNHSTYYAMSVHQLAQALDSRMDRPVRRIASAG
jgi:membrane-bound lytic murein transglycosylase B